MTVWIKENKIKSAIIAGLIIILTIWFAIHMINNYHKSGAAETHSATKTKPAGVAIKNRNDGQPGEIVDEGMVGIPTITTTTKNSGAPPPIEMKTLKGSSKGSSTNFLGSLEGGYVDASNNRGIINLGTISGGIYYCCGETNNVHSIAQAKKWPDGYTPDKVINVLENPKVTIPPGQDYEFRIPKGWLTKPCLSVNKDEVMGAYNLAPITEEPRWKPWLEVPENTPASEFRWKSLGSEIRVVFTLTAQ